MTSMTNFILYFKFICNNRIYISYKISRPLTKASFSDWVEWPTDWQILQWGFILFLWWFTTGSDGSQILLIVSTRLSFWIIFLEMLEHTFLKILLSISNLSRASRSDPSLNSISSQSWVNTLWTVRVIEIHGPGRSPTSSHI